MDIAESATTSKDAGSINPLHLLNIVRSAGGALFAQATLHAELAQVEWEEEKQRLSKCFIFTLIGFAFFICLLFFTGLFVILLSWHSEHRILIFTALLLSYFIGFIYVIFKIKAISNLGKQSFAATKAEIAADIALIKSAL